MNRTQHLTSSQPRPKRRVARPGVCALQIVSKPTMAANDDNVARGNELPGALATRESKVSRSRTRGPDEQFTQIVGAKLALLDRCAALIAVDLMPRCIITDNGKEFHSPAADAFSASLKLRSAEAANSSMRGGK